MHQEPPVEWPIVPNSEPEGMFPNRLTKVRNVTGLRSLPTRDGERRCQWPANPSSLTAMFQLVTRAMSAAGRRNGWSKSKSWNHLTRRLDAASGNGSAPRVLNRQSVPRGHRHCDCDHALRRVPRRTRRWGAIARRGGPLFLPRFPPYFLAVAGGGPVGPGVWLLWLGAVKPVLAVVWVPLLLL